MIKKKIIQFATKNWKEILIVLSMLAVIIKTQIDYRAILEAHELARDEMRLQIESLREIHAEELRKREEALQTYRDTIEQIERNYLSTQVAIEEVRQETAAEYVRQFSQDRETLANEIIDAYGFEFVE